MRRRFLFFLSICFVAGTTAVAQSMRSGDRYDIQRTGYSAAVAVNDGTLFIGEPSNTVTPGLVYIYNKDANGEWVLTGKLTADDAVEGDRFGTSIATTGDRLIVSATSQNDGSGAVHVFEKADDGIWSHAARLTVSDAAEGDGLGNSLAVSGHTLLVGASNQNDDTGAVYAFTSDGTGNWSQGAKLVASDGESNDLFGASIAVAGETAFIGAPGKSSREGVVYIFASEGGEWIEQPALGAFGIDRNSRFGFSLAVEGESLLIGAARHQRSMGAAFLYTLEDGDWNQTGMLVPFDASPNTRFGTAVSFVEGNVWIGAPGANSFGGAIYSLQKDENGNWSSAKKLVARDGARQTLFGTSMAVDGVVAVVGQPGADGGTGTALVFEKRDGDWTEVARLMGDIDALESITGNQVDCEEGKADRFDCEAIDMISFMSIKDLGGGRGINLNDVWGWTDPETGKEWALVGRTNGTAFVDVSDPYNPLYFGELLLTEGARPASWRDIKVYKDHAFIVSDGSGSHGMQVFDLTRLRDVRDMPYTFVVDALYEGVHSVHNIVINEETGFAYAVGSNSGGDTCGGGLHMINIQDPLNPTFAGCFADNATGRSGTGYSHDAMCIVYHGPDPDHQEKEICFGANETALSIVDVSDKSDPVALSSASYPNVGYAHQGWISEDHKYFYLNDELDELSGRIPSTRTLVWDVADLDDPQLIKEHQSAQKSSDHNLYVRGNVMYQSNYSAGLRVLDISDPANPVEVAYFDTFPFGENEPGFNGSWSNYPYFGSGIIVVTGIGEGLFVVKRKEVDI